MEENDRIKIKTGIFDSILILSTIGVLTYMGVLAIKLFLATVKTGNKIDMLLVILVIFIILLIYLSCVFDLINIGRRIELTKEGCMISFLWIKRKYSWEEYPIKKVERYSDQYNSWAPSTPYKEGAVFSKVPVKRSKKYRPAEPRSYLTRYVFSTVWVCFRNEMCKKKWTRYYTDFFEVDKEEFFQKMKEWGVKLEMPE